MSAPQRHLPNELLIELGRITTVWAMIEQCLILSVSAIAAQYTAGEPKECIPFGFKRLRKKWYQLSTENLSSESKGTITKLNDKLAKYSEIRGFTIHGEWVAKSGEDSYHVQWWEQKESLKFCERDISVGELSKIADDLNALYFELDGFTSGKESKS